MSALLVAFVLVLAVLQYRWTGQISEAERERMRASLNSSVRRFAEELDDEIARVLRSFRFPGGDRAAFVRAARAFHDESFYPSIVGAFFWVTGDADGSGLVWSRSGSDSSSTNSTEADAVPSIYSSASPMGGSQPCGAKYPGFCADSKGV